MNLLTSKNSYEENNILEKNEKYTISEIKDDNINIKYIIFMAILDNGNRIFIIRHNNNLNAKTF